MSLFWCNGNMLTSHGIDRGSILDAQILIAPSIPAFCNVNKCVAILSKLHTVVGLVDDKVPRSTRQVECGGGRHPRPPHYLPLHHLFPPPPNPSPANHSSPPIPPVRRQPFHRRLQLPWPLKLRRASTLHPPPQASPVYLQHPHQSLLPCQNPSCSLLPLRPHALIFHPTQLLHLPFPPQLPRRLPAAPIGHLRAHARCETRSSR